MSGLYVVLDDDLKVRLKKQFDNPEIGSIESIPVVEIVDEDGNVVVITWRQMPRLYAALTMICEDEKPDEKRLRDAVAALEERWSRR